MTYAIHKAAVIGSGTMGGGIAALLAGIGVEVLLLDIPAKDTQPGDPADKRNAIVINNLKTLQKMRPSQLFSEHDMALISVGNTDDDLHKLADRDWVIEVVVENLAIKQSLMARVAAAIGPHTIVTTNTSGLPIHDIASQFGEDFTRRFMGTHFFNPPRYLHLLEVIPHSNTDPELIAFMQDFGSRKLGKGVVICKDTPNFIGNRFMSMTGMQAMNYALDHGFTVEEVDAITGPLIGRPKTATFNLNDLVGFDIAVHVARNLYPAIPDDPARDVLAHAGSAELSEYMLANKMLGRKTDGGFYKMIKADGKKKNSGRSIWRPASTNRPKRSNLRVSASIRKSSRLVNASVCCSMKPIVLPNTSGIITLSIWHTHPTACRKSPIAFSTSIMPRNGALIMKWVPLKSGTQSA